MSSPILKTFRTHRSQLLAWATIAACTNRRLQTPDGLIAGVDSIEATP